MKKSSKGCIDIYLRFRPSKTRYNGYEIEEENKMLNVIIPKQKEAGYINNTKVKHTFKFNKIFNETTKQDQIFEELATDVIDSVLDGYNGTLFAYGPTGSGKTYTITGGTEKYADRGIIPRTLSYIFSKNRESSDTFYQISISYLEIYNNVGYDLLDENHSTNNLLDLPKVIPYEGVGEQIQLKGLSMHKAQTEEDAINLLFIGDTNRIVSETPKNDVSSRSHCIFIIQIEGRKANSDVKTVSRLHLVDLAGSERIGKTGVEGKIRKEAVNINLALHYLEFCIICLQKQAHGENVHIPYRNSLMTLVLRDSLGGNCITRMIATSTLDAIELEETIQTCSFAQRVALIQNKIEKNVQVDPSIIIERLKRENAELRAEIALLKGGDNSSDTLTAEDRQQCKELVDKFVVSRDPTQNIILSDRLKINECFYYFKQLYNDILRKSKNSDQNQNPSQVSIKQNQVENTNAVGSKAQDQEIQKLKLLIQQRDNEIMILLNLLNKQKEQNPNSDQSMGITVHNINNSNNTMVIDPQTTDLLDQSKVIAFPKYEKKAEKIEQSMVNDTTKFTSNQNSIQKPYQQNQNKTNEQSRMTLYQTDLDRNKEATSIVNSQFNQMLYVPLNLTNEQLLNRGQAFDMFRKSYRKNELVEENKNILKEKFAEGKKLGMLVNDSRTKIESFKNQIEELRKQMVILGLESNGQAQQNATAQLLEEENQLSKQIDDYKQIYRVNFNKLKMVKQEIGNLQSLIEQNTKRLQTDFQKWLQVMLQQRGMQYNSQNVQQDIQQIKQQQQQKNAIDDLKQLPEIKDRKVQDKLKQFYEARDQIYNNQ